ncbi:hypothetical protein O4J56_07085 [Nocardiopsis sp. RSe5-2]|uniref:DUF3558 domain-containing protein n=1 Tax=Nocardiopsis endophytica TaxID=3018445 RepID=A0ABT4U0C3_9ACTN|nr:hypothetical protein [Nocardiopsis endophytica]MDA2810399.1 hypothetical protein [Nocardiopsis endophytica]
MFALPRGLPRTPAAAAAAVAAVTLAAGCAAGEPSPSPKAPGGSPSGPPEAPPAWEAFGGVPLDPPGGPSGEASAADEAEAPDGAEPVEVPGTCEAAGLPEDAEAFAAMAPEGAQFTQVRGERVLECSWAGFDRGDGSEVVLVSLASEGSLAETPGALPPQVGEAVAEGSRAYFTTPGLTALGGFAEWRPGERFSRVRLHLPGLLVTVQANSDMWEEEGGAAVEAATAAAEGLLD